MNYEHKVHSQHGEDGIIHELLRRARSEEQLGTGVALEIGCRADENNTLALRELGWRVITVDARPGEADVCEWVTADDVAERACCAWGVPRDLDFLSIDVDGQDLWIMDALLTGGYRPRVICVEYNAAWGAVRSISVPEQADWTWIPRTNWFGASLLALARRAATHGYILVGCESSGTNAFFVRAECWDAPAETPEARAARLFRSPTYAPFPPGDGPVVDIVQAAEECDTPPSGDTEHSLSIAKSDHPGDLITTSADTPECDTPPSGDTEHSLSIAKSDHPGDLITTSADTPECDT